MEVDVIVVGYCRSCTADRGAAITDASRCYVYFGSVKEH